MEDDDLPGRVNDTASLLEAIAADRGLLAGIDDALRERLLIAAGQVSRPEKRARKALARARLRKARKQRVNEDQALLDRTAIRELRANPIFITPRRQALYGEEGASESLGEVHAERTCYVCRRGYTEVHFFQACEVCYAAIDTDT